MKCVASWWVADATLVIPTHWITNHGNLQTELQVEWSRGHSGALVGGIIVLGYSRKNVTSASHVQAPGLSVLLFALQAHRLKVSAATLQP